MERKLVTIRVIKDIKSINGADAIEHVQVDGWWVVAKKGEFKVGDQALYFEIDSWIPTELAPFLSKGKEPSEYKGIKGERLRTIKLRGAISQGLLLPYQEGIDVESFNVIKWEKELPAQLRGMAKGNFPTFIPKTDEERVQNIQEFSIGEYYVTEKLHGSSITVYYKDGEIGVCSRNLDLKETEGNTYWKVARLSGVIDLLLKIKANVAIQGELVGPGVNGNQYKLQDHELYVFNMFDIDAQMYFPWHTTKSICEDEGIKCVPTLHTYFIVSKDQDREALLNLYDGLDSVVTQGVMAEGVVFKTLSNEHSFKVISNSWLLKTGE